MERMEDGIITKRGDFFYQSALPSQIARAYPEEDCPVCICFAANDSYAPYLRVALYSLLVNANPSRCYDILIMTKDITQKYRETIQKLSKLQKAVSIRFLNMTKLDQKVDTIIQLIRSLHLPTLQLRLFM